MKVKLGLLFIGLLVIASGCARKCPPCPSCATMGSYGTSSYTAPAATTSASDMNAAPADSGASQYGSATGRYVNK